MGRRSAPRFWAQNGPIAQLLTPVALGFQGLVRWRRQRYQNAGSRIHWIDCPVIVVGNISVGGTGKTPLVITLLEQAKAMGRHPGVVLRGYGGRSRSTELVSAQSDPAWVGDEAVLIAQRTCSPVCVGRNRSRAAQALLDTGTVDLIISDDGLQHYALGRDVEIAVIDGQRGLGNGRCLPAGPLREPPERLDSVDSVIANGADSALAEGRFDCQPAPLRRLQDDPAGLANDAAPEPGSVVHAVAGIGNPERFFRSLEGLGYTLIRHALDDHHAFGKTDFAFDDQIPIVLTEKDAVKCHSIAPSNTWVLPIRAVPTPASAERLDTLIDLAIARYSQRRCSS